MYDSTGQSSVSSRPGAEATDILTLEKSFSQAKSVRERFIPNWYLNLAYFLGQQWLFWNAGRLDRPNLGPRRKTPVDNRILPIVTARAARKIKNRPVFIGTPFNSDEEAIEAALVGEKALESDWLHLNLADRLYQALLYADICCAGFWKVYWDDTKGEKQVFLFGEDGQPFLQGNGQPVRADALGGQIPPGLTAKPVAAGDACVEVLSPFEIFPDPLATSLDDCEWLIEEKVRSQEYIWQRYGVEVQPDAPAPVGPVESRLFATAQYASGGDAEEYKGVKVYEKWYRPNSTYPDGKKCCWAGGQILDEDEQPFDPMPYVMFPGITSPNRFWPTSLVTQLRGPQTSLNKLMGQIEENVARFGNPSLMRSRQANIEWSGLPGGELQYDSTVPDAVPQFLEAPEIPVYAKEQVDRIIDSMTEIGGLHDVSQGTVPAGVEAASAINLLQEADDTRIAPEIQAMERTIALAGSKLLRLRAQFNSDERLLRIAGEDGNWDIIAFRGEMLGKEPTVEVQAGSAMPRSKAAKQAAMTEILSLAFQYGIEFDPRDLRKFFKDYEVGGLDRLFGTIGNDETQVQREHRQMGQGMPVQPNDYDQHQYHVDAHNDYRKTNRFTKLPDQVKLIFDLHVKAHQEYLVQTIHSQMAAQTTEQLNQEQTQLDMQPPPPPEPPPTQGGGSNENSGS